MKKGTLLNNNLCPKCKINERVGSFAYCNPCNTKKQQNYKANNPMRFRNIDIKARAKRKNIPHNIDLNHLQSIWTGKCAVFNTPLEFNDATLDRINNDKGYIIGNVAWISWRANKLKSDGTLEEFQQIVKYMEDHV